MNLKQTLTDAIKAYEGEGTPLPTEILIRAVKVGVSIKAVTGTDIPSINSAYRDQITESLTGYFEVGGSIATYKNQFKRATAEAFGVAFELGWKDGGGGADVEPDAQDWLASRLDSELAFIDGLFIQARELRKDDEFDFFSWVTARADGYVKAVAEVYNVAKMWANKNQMLTWRLGNTEKHCPTCASLDGKSHRAKWYIAHNYIPKKAGADMKCGGYNCDCRLEDKDGKEFIL